VAVTGGFSIHLDSIRFAVRSPLRAVLLAVLGGAAAWRLSTSDDRRMARERIGQLWSRLLRLDPSVMIAAVGIALTIFRWAGGRPLWLDEEMIALNLRDRRLVDLSGALWLGQSAPFGWLAVQRAVVLTLGTGERALRLLPMLYGVGTLAMAVWVGRRWMTRMGAVVLMLLFAFGPSLSYYAVELKHYSADAFWALLLPVLGAWAIDTGADRPHVETRRLVIWWSVAAAGHWFANGGLLVAPGCAVLLLVVLWRRNGWRAALVFGLFGCVWLASFALHYLVALRHTVNSEYLRGYWSRGLPPASSGVTGTLIWLAARVKPLAINPGGTSWPLMFWMMATCGFALSASPTLGLVLATVPVSAFALAALRIVPLHERLSLWIVPALYMGIALFTDRAVRYGRDAYVRRPWPRLALAVAVALAGYPLWVDMVKGGTEDVRTGYPFNSNHGLNDRTGMRWLMRQRQPGDVLMTTELALPALWWYGGIPISNRDLVGGRQPDGSPILQVGYGSSGSDCQRNQLREVLNGERRVLVYFGFRFDDVPGGFDELLLGGLQDLGRMMASETFADAGDAAVIDLRPASATDSTASADETKISPRASTWRLSSSRPLHGCVVVRTASRW
jgi:hypothetical protein